MREILFRGKRVDNGTWAYGDLLHCDYEMEIDSESLGENGGYIIPETVGQYTGLKDKSGTKIFEGDIVEILLSGKHGIGIVEYGKSGISAYVAMSHSVYSNYVLNKSDNFIVLGNIYDNPELMEATK